MDEKKQDSVRAYAERLKRRQRQRRSSLHQAGLDSSQTSRAEDLLAVPDSADTASSGVPDSADTASSGVPDSADTASSTGRGSANAVSQTRRSASNGTPGAAADYPPEVAARLRSIGIEDDMTPDIFDRLVAWGIKFRYFKWFGPIYKRYKEFLLYALFGLGTMLISINVYLTLTNRAGWTILVAEAVSWFFATLFAFFTNRKWVFTYAPKGVKAFFQQLFSFFCGRGLTLGLEEAILHIFVLGFGFPNTKVEYVAQIFIIAANYVFSKLVVFRRRTIARRHTRRFDGEKDPDGYRSKPRKKQQ